MIIEDVRHVLNVFQGQIQYNYDRQRKEILYYHAGLDEWWVQVSHETGRVSFRRGLLSDLGSYVHEANGASRPKV